MLVVSILIIISDGFPILYRGRRTGLNGKQFYIYKFRTMINDAEMHGGYSTALNDPRLIKFGRFFRKFKLDEFPQIFNVILGSMSIVGPRPQVEFYTSNYDEIERIILEVNPGITDLASIYFSDLDSVLGDSLADTTYKTKVEPIKNKLRVYYVKNRSFSLDFHILLSTFLKLFFNKTTKRVDLILKQYEPRYEIS